MKQVLLLLTVLVASVVGVPSSFDLRVQTEIKRYTTYDLQPEGICAGYAWAKEIAQIVSNAVGLYEEEKIGLSAQQILQCTEPDSDICYRGTLQNIHNAIRWISREGITSSDCYINRPLEYPDRLCRRECHDGRPFSFDFLPTFTKVANFSQVVNALKANEKVALMAVIKTDAAFNYFSAFNQKLTVGGPSEVFEYRVAEIVGWKEAITNLKIILRTGPGDQWGFNGFIDLEVAKYGKYIEQFYVVQLANQVGKGRRRNIESQII